MKTSLKQWVLAGVALSVLGACAASSPGPTPPRSDAPPPPVEDSNAVSGNQSWSVPQSEKLLGGEKLAIPPERATIVSETTTAVVSAHSPAPEANLDARLDALEKAVTDLRGDYDRMMPAFNQLIVMNDRIKDVLDKVQTIPSAEPTPAADPAPAQAQAAVAQPVQLGPQAVPAPTAEAPPVATPAPAAAVSAATVKNVRIGEHPDKTRIVIDLSAPAPFKAEVDNAEKILIVDIAAGQWEGPKEGKPRSALISSYSYQPGVNGNSVLAVQLKEPAKILSTRTLAASEGMGPRLVIDVGAGP